MPYLLPRAERVLIVFLACAVSACAGDREVAEQAQQELVGQSTTRLFTCAGTPDREIIYSKQNEEVSYYARRDGSGFMITSTRYQDGDDGDGPGYCRAVFEMFTGVVQKVRYVDADGVTLEDPKHCALIVSSCVAQNDDENDNDDDDVQTQ